MSGNMHGALGIYVIREDPPWRLVPSETGPLGDVEMLDPKTIPLVSMGYCIESRPPWRSGRGVRVRFGGRGWQVGVYRKKAPVERELSVDPGRIGRWGNGVEGQTAGDEEGA